MTQEHAHRVYDLFNKTNYNDLVEVIEAIYNEEEFENPIFKTLGIYDILTKRKSDNAKKDSYFLTCSHPERRMLIDIGQTALYILYLRTKPYIDRYNLEDVI